MGKSALWSNISNNNLLFSRSVMSSSLWSHVLQHAQLPCPSLFPRVHSHSHPLSWWCHSTISSFVTPFSSHLQCFLSSEAFPMSQLFVSGGQSIGASASTISLSSEYSGVISFRIDLFDLLSVQGTLKSLLQHLSSKASILQCSAFFTCVPHPDPPSHLPLHPLPLGLPSASGPSACLMHPTWAGDLFHPR